MENDKQIKHFVHSKITETKQVSLTFIDDRPRTLLGPQGDHVSSYALFKELVLARVEDLTVEESIKVILGIIDTYAPNKETQRIFEIAKSELLLSDKIAGNQKILLELKEKAVSEETIEIIKNTLDEYRMIYLSQLMDKLVSLHLTLRNKLELTSFASDLVSIQPPKDEGAQVRKALKYLKSLKEKEISASVDAIVDNILKLIWYPRIPEEDLIYLNDAKIWKAIIKKKNYRVNTKPRDNNLKTLAQVMSNHLTLIFDVFSSLSKNEDITQKIIEEFIERMLSKESNHVYSWKLEASEKKEVKTQISMLLQQAADIGVGSMSSGTSEGSLTPNSVEENDNDDEDYSFGPEYEKKLKEEAKTYGEKMTRSKSKNSDLIRDEIDSISRTSSVRGAKT